MGIPRIIRIPAFNIHPFQAPYPSTVSGNIRLQIPQRPNFARQFPQGTPWLPRPVLPLRTESLPAGTEYPIHKDSRSNHRSVRKIPNPATNNFRYLQIPCLLLRKPFQFRLRLIPTHPLAHHHPLLRLNIPALLSLLHPCRNQNLTILLPHPALRPTPPRNIPAPKGIHRTHQPFLGFLRAPSATDSFPIGTPAIIRRIFHHSGPHRIQINICRHRPCRQPILHNHTPEP